MTAPTAKRRRRGRPRVALFDADERIDWRVPAPIKPSEWAERHRVLLDGETDMPGPWRNDLAPYLRGIMDIPLKCGVAAALLQKASQLGISEALRNVIGFLADREPDPVGLVLPDKAKGRKIVSERIIPLFETTPRLRELLPRRRAAVQKEMLRCVNGFLLWLAWAGSPTTTKGEPWRVGVIDELDECALAVARLGQTRDLVGAVGKRMRTYGERACLIAASTPLEVLSEIAAQVAAARFLLEFYVPCPACGAWQTLDFDHVRFQPPEEAIRKDRHAWAAWVLEDPDRTVYECRHCAARWREEQRPAIVRAGKWCSSARQDKEGNPVGRAGVGPRGEPLTTDAAAGVIFDAEALDEFPRGSTVGMKIWAGYSLLGVTLSSVAAEFIAAQHDRGRMFTFTTETLGEIFEHQLAKVDADVFVDNRKRATLDEGIVPAWAGKLLAAVDTQIDTFVVVIRAWGENHLSQRVWHGVVSTFAELEKLCFQTPWRCEDETCGPMVCEMVGIDSGGTTDVGADSSRTMEVYRWAQKRKDRVRALKGFESLSSRTGQFLWLGKGLLAEQGATGIRRKREVPLWCLAKHEWQSVLQDYINAGLRKRRGKPKADEDERELWLLNRRADPRYERELANAQQVLERFGKTSRPVHVWKPVRPGGRWDYRDAEVYQCVLASIARVDVLPPTEQIIAFRREQWRQIQAAQKAAHTPPPEDRGDWLNTGGGKWV